MGDVCTIGKGGVCTIGMGDVCTIGMVMLYNWHG